MMKRLRRVMAAVLMMCLVITGPAVARAATESASNLDELAKIVTEHGLKRDSKFDVNYKGPFDDLVILLARMTENLFFFNKLSMYDDPTTSNDADYLTGNIQLYNDTVDVDVDENESDSTLKFNIRYFETLPQTEYVNGHVPQILSKLGVSNKSNYEKVKAIHDYVCDLITWTDGEEDWVSSMWGALTKRKALCNAYALCMYKLLVEAGVPCKYIGGKAGTGVDSGGHAWNIVALGDKWYNLDTTWDDDDDNKSWGYDYFLKGSSDFDEEDPEQIHTMDKPYLSDSFKNAFPIAKTAFKKGMNDENVSIKIGDESISISDPTTPNTSDDPDVTDDTKYTFKDIVYTKDPSNGKFSIKKGKSDYLMLNINEGMESLLKKATYKVTTGKKNVKVSYCTIDEDEYGTFVTLKYKGKKKGKVNIKITLKLTNGQTLSYTFKGKIK